ncbi:hypothetical protein V8E36_009171 [Tilletia maclaganii]
MWRPSSLLAANSSTSARTSCLTSSHSGRRKLMLCCDPRTTTTKWMTMTISDQSSTTDSRRTRHSTQEGQFCPLSASSSKATTGRTFSTRQAHTPSMYTKGESQSSRRYMRIQRYQQVDSRPNFTPLALQLSSITFSSRLEVLHFLSHSSLSHHIVFKQAAGQLAFSIQPPASSHAPPRLPSAQAVESGSCAPSSHSIAHGRPDL